MRQRQRQKASYAFTLAELLIALAILGVIAAFSIPKVLQAQQENHWNSVAKETAGMLTQAYQLYKLNGGDPTQMKAANITPYMNYIKIFTNNEQVSAENTGTYSCLSNHPCLYFTNGSSLAYWVDDQFGGTAATNGMPFILDVDAQPGGATGIVFWLYYSGKLRTRSSIDAGTTDSSGQVWNPGSGEPPWFHWN